MTNRFPALAALTLAFSAAAAAQTAPPKTAILQVQNAILATAEGHQAFSALEQKLAAKKTEFNKQQNELTLAQDRLRIGAATMTEAAQRQLAREIDRKGKALNYEMETAQTEFEQEQADLVERIGRKFRAVADKYARDQGFGLILDVTNQQTPVFWFATALDITNEVVRAYDAANPAKP